MLASRRLLVLQYHVLMLRHKKTLFRVVGFNFWDLLVRARLLSAVGSTSDSRARGPRFDTQSSHILLFLHLLIQEGQLSVTCKKYVHEVLVNCLGDLSLPRKKCD